MFRNILLSSIRNFVRQPIYSFINVLGLTLGLSCSILIFLWVLDEVTANNHHKDKERIFQVMENETYTDGAIVTYGGTRAPLAQKLKEELPEVDQAIHLTWPEQKLFAFGSQSLYEEGIYADSGLFSLFTFEFIQGTGSGALPDNSSVAISRTMASKFFRKETALGKSFTVDNKIDLKVTAVFEDMPDNSHLRFDYVLPFNIYSTMSGAELGWDHANVETYVKLKSSDSKDVVERKIRSMMHRADSKQASIPITSSWEVGGPGGDVVDLFLFPMTDWRLHSKFEGGKQSGGRITYVVSFSLIAIFILTIACINFMNLSTARAARRSREIGIRKVAGASRISLIRQFMTESLFISFLSLVIALLVVQLLLPFFNELTGKNLFVDYSNPYITLSLFGIALITGVLAGCYPAFFLSSFKPASVLKGNLFSTWKGAGLRQGLVVVQFSMSVILIVCSLAVNEQINFIRHKDLGFDKDNVIYFQPQPGVFNRYESFRDELLKNPLIQHVAQGDSKPMEIFNNDYATWNGIPEDAPATVQTSGVDHDYLQTMGFTLREGRNFSRNLASDTASFIINESSAKLMGFDQPIGQDLKVYKFHGKIIGVIKDFNNNDLHAGIDPVIFLLTAGSVENPMKIFVRYKPGEYEKALAHLQSVYHKFEPDFPLEYQFLDAAFERQYRIDILMGRLTICFTLLAIFVSCIGLFGLTLFTTERRTKEIGVRKVLGASVSDLIRMLCSDFARPVLFALLFGSLPAYYLVNGFLEQYTFRVELNAWIFIKAAVALVIISLLTVVYQSTKTAMRNPVEALRTE